MAYTRVTNTKDGRAAIRYAFEEASHKQGMDRVLASSGSNIDTRFAMQQMRDVWQSYGKNDGNTVQVYRVIQSFGLDELDPNNPEDVETANEIGLVFANEMYPDKQALVVTQADGEGGKLHNHVLVNSVGFVDGKSLRGNRKEWKDISEKTNEVMRRYGFNPPPIPNATRDKTTMAEYQLEQQGEYVWKSDLKRRIQEGASEMSVTSEDAFVEHMKDVHGVTVKYRGNEKDEDENAIKGISYSFEDESGKKRTSRAWRLGSDYQSAALSEQFEANAVLLEEEQQKSDRKQKVGSFSFDFDIDAELEAIRKPKASKRRAAKAVETPLMKQVREEREEIRKIDRLHVEALQENTRFDEIREAQRREQLEEQRQQELAERSRREQESQKKQEAKERAERLQQQRERTKERIWSGIGMNGEPRGITDEFADRFTVNEQAWKGKHVRTVSGSRPITVFDVYRGTEKQIREEQRRQEGSQVQLIQEHVAEEHGPEL